MRRIRVAPRIWATSPDTQAGRRPYGVSAREPGEESIQKVLQMAVARSTGALLPREGIDFGVVLCSQQVL